jgi:hypothetical protein
MENDIKKRHDFLRWNKLLKFKNVKRISGIVGDPYHVGLSRASENAIQVALNSGLPFIFFEDDAAPTKHYADEIEIPDDADAVYLGVSPWGFGRGDDSKKEAVLNGSVFKEVDGFPGVFKVHNTLTTHAILYINKGYALAAIESYKKAIALEHFGDVQIYLDGLFDKYNVYAVGPLFYQNDLSKPHVLEETKNVIMKELNGNN